MGDNEILKSNKTDIITAGLKSVFGVVPFAGSLLSELAGTLIPDQRMDRLGKFVIALDGRLNKFEAEFVKSKLKDETFSDLLEQSLIDASRALSDERRQYIASIIEHSLDEEHISFSESKHLMRLLNELSDVEIIWLRSYLYNTFGGDEEFRGKHEAILAPIIEDSNSGQEDFDKKALQTSYKEHLARLGLIDAHYNADWKTGAPIYNSFTHDGKPELRGYTITSLGKLLLKHIGLVPLRDSEFGE